MQHILKKRLVLPLPLAQVFGFYSDAGNLERITPSELGFQIITPQPIEMAAGTRIDYRLKLFGIPFTWQTHITHWDAPFSFVDVQARGPYKEWIHTHRFYEEGNSTVVEDEVRYRLRYFPLGELSYPLVRWQLDRIFQYREQAVKQLLSPAAAELAAAENR